MLVGTNATFDLSQTLPATVTRGGTFSVNPAGANLPSGMSLSGAGILAVGSASIGTITGVIFGYTLP